jgi:MFS family permease
VKALPSGTASEPRIADRRPGFFGALRFRDFRLLWGGLLVSNLGTWMQFTALGYEVVHLAPNAHLAALYVGLIGAARSVPVLLLSPFAGVVADRFPRRRVLLATNTVSAVLSFVLALVIAGGVASIGLLMVLSGLLASTQSFDAPARQSWVPIMVPREFVGNAIGLNSLAFNSPAAVGPPIAGLIIAGGGVSPCMFANAVLTLAVVAALSFMQPVPASSSRRDSVWLSIRAGIAFLARHPVLRWIVLLLVVTSLLVRPYNFLLPAYAAHVLDTDARGLGALMAATGLGAMIGAIAIAAIVPQRRSALWAVSAVVIALGAIGLGSTASLPIALCVLAVMGFATMTFMGSSNILLQTLAPDDMRGRVISVYSMVALGLVPAGTLLLGSIASLLDLREAFVIGGGGAAACAIWIYLAHPRLREV